nr:protein ABHD17C-like [Tanacetum cinerariifolium]
MTSSVAARFAFYPPSPPSYMVVVTDDNGGRKKMRLSDVNERENVDVLKVKTKKGTDIVLMFVKNPIAKMTVLYSHGNAADLGQIHELFCQLSVQLKVNIMGPPSYMVVVTDDDGGRKKMRLSDVNERENVDVLKVKTKKGTDIVLMFVKNPIAKMTILYSHGNAADLGQMHELFCQLSVF